MLKVKSFLLVALFLAPTVAVSDPWDSLNDPAHLSADYRYEYESLPLSGRVTDSAMPWSDNYWESDWAGISLRWNLLTPEQLDPDLGTKIDKKAQFRYVPPTREQVRAMSRDELAQLSPAEKYDILLGRYDYPTVRAERARTNPSMDDWQGLCHGWVPASINHHEPEPKDLAGADGVVVPFGSTDIKALLSYYYGVTAYDYARGKRLLRNNGGVLEYLEQVDTLDLASWLVVPPQFVAYVDGYSVITERLYTDRTYIGFVDQLNRVSQIGRRAVKRDLFGVKGIKDPNPGAFHVVMANQLGLMNEPFIGNINKKLRNVEVWNQPIVGYSSRILRDERQDNGQRKIEVRTRLTYVSEIAQYWEPVVGTDKQRYGEMEFDYELDIQGGRIVGGKWEKRAKHPSFAWKHGKIPIQGYFSRLNELSRPR